MRYVFGDYTLDTGRYELRHAGTPVKLRLKVFHMLAYLVAHRDRAIPKQELCEHLWPQQFISDATLDSCIAEARRAVGDSGRVQGLIQTVHGYGYRFVAAVEVYGTAAEAERQRTSTAAGPALSREAPSRPPERRAVSVPGTVGVACAVCQHRNSPEVMACLGCGTLLAQACPQCKRIVRLPATTCPACGYKLVAPPSGDVHTASCTTYQVLGPDLRPAYLLRHGVRPSSPLVGRALELATLEVLLRRAEDSQGQVVSLVGEPGMGKTRLVHEFCQRLTPPRVMVLVGRCVAYGQATPYLPVCEMLRQACRLPEGEPPATATAQMHQQLQALGMAAVEAAPYLFHLLGMPDATLRLAGVSPQVIRRRTFTVLHELFLRLGQRQPLLIVVENLHWSDPTSQEYLTELVERLVGMPLLLLVTFRPGYRPDWMEKSYATQVTLARLDPEDSRQVVQAVLHPAPCPEPLLQGIVTKAAGNPLFLEELAWAVQEQGSLPLEVPAMVQAVLAARIDRLPETARSLLQTAAVIGPEGPLALLQAATELPEATLERGLLRLRAAEFLYEAHLGPAPTYVFKHVLTQEAAYQSLLTRTRQQLHQRIARVLEARLPEVCETQPERLAHHYTEAGLQQQAMAYWQQAGQRALERSANAEAIAHLTKALALLQAFPDTPERAQHELHVQTTLGPALMAIKGWGAPEVEAAYTRARALCQQVGETPQLFLVLWGLWRVYSERAEHRTARELGEHLLRLARRLGDRAFLLQAHHALWPTLLYLGELAPAYAHAEQGMALYDLQQHRTHAFVYGGHDPGVCCRQVAALELWFLGYPDQARQQAAAALSLAQELAHPMSLVQALYWASWLHQLRREAPAAQAQLEELLALSTAQEFALILARGTVLHGWALAAQGQVAAGVVQMQHGLAAHQATGAAAFRPYFLALLAEGYGQAGQAAEGLHVLDEALAAAHQHAEHFYTAELYRLQGELLLQSGGQPRISRVSVPHAEKAEACFQQALGIARQQQARSLELRAAVSLSRLWQQQGKRAAARALLTPVYAWFAEGFDTADLHLAQTLLTALRA